jgi:hypothetical protein
MIFSLLLTVLFMFMAIYILVFIRSRFIRVLLGAAYVTAIYFVWSPESTNTIAHFFGIGRGLDFFLILLSIAIVNALVLLARHINVQHQALTRLSRHIALLNARSSADHTDEL